MRRLVPLLAVLTSAILVPQASSAATGPPLGKKANAGAYGEGWGKPHPGRIYLGGVPSGLAYKIKWASWGSRMAYGRGWSPQYKPQGGYYRKSVRVQFRATNLGTCRGNSTNRYRRLLIRKQERPGGPWEPWHSWGLNLCAGNYWEPPVYTSCEVEIPDNEDSIIDRISYLDIDCATAATVIEANPWPNLAVESEESESHDYLHAGFQCSGYTSTIWDGEVETDERQASWSCINWQDGSYLAYRQR